MAKISKTGKGKGKGYDVGFKKPPIGSQFKKGKSGNPSGKPKKALGIKEALIKEGNKEVTITENGKQLTVTKNEVVAKATFAKAHKGDLKAIKYIADNQPVEPETKSLTQDFCWTEEHEAILKRINDHQKDEEK